MSVDVATLSPSSELWQDARVILALAGLSQAEVDYWSTVVAPEAHRLGHPVPMLGCPGCLVEANVGGVTR